MEIGPLQELSCPCDPLRLDSVGRSIAQPRRIDEPDRDAVDGDRFLDRVARRSGDRRDDRPFTSEERVEKGRLAGVRLAADDDEGALAEKIPRTPVGEESAGLSPELLETEIGLAVEVVGHLVLIEIEKVLEFGSDRDEIIVERSDIP